VKSVNSANNAVVALTQQNQLLVQQMAELKQFTLGV